LATCSANLRAIHQPTMNYAADNDGRFPVAKHPQNNYIIALAGTIPRLPTLGFVGLSGSSVAVQDVLCKPP
jgi:hypothetical protein